MSDWKDGFSSQEGAYLAHNLKLNKGLPSHICHLLLKQESWVREDSLDYAPVSSGAVQPIQDQRSRYIFFHLQSSQEAADYYSIKDPIKNRQICSRQCKRKIQLSISRRKAHSMVEFVMGMRWVNVRDMFHQFLPSNNCWLSSRDNN